MLKNNPQKGAYVNHKSVQANIHTVKQNIDKEVLLGRMAGPFVSPPLKKFVTSPLGLVPKKEAGQFRLIHDLSFPRGHSVNSNIDTYFATVQYENLDHCVDIIQKLGPNTLMAKADIQEAFRNVPIHPKDYKFLGCVPPATHDNPTFKGKKGDETNEEIHHWLSELSQLSIH
jgi:hypothetical protein